MLGKSEKDGAAVRFWTPGHRPADGAGFGCAVHGWAAQRRWVDPAGEAVAAWDPGVPRRIFAGDATTVLTACHAAALRPRAAIVLGARGNGMEAFLRELTALYPGVPAIGGVAARKAGLGGDSMALGELLPAAEMGVMLLCGGRWRVDTLNVHDADEPYEFKAREARTVSDLRVAGKGRWRPAAEVAVGLQSRFGRPAGDMECLTFSDCEGVNRHFRVEGRTLVSGADLPPDGRLVLRHASPEAITSRVRAFVSSPEMLVIGCAGLRGVLSAPVRPGAGSVLGFFWGEVVGAGRTPCFGNLMMARLMRCG